MAFLAYLLQGRLEQLPLLFLEERLLSLSNFNLLTPRKKAHNRQSRMPFLPGSVPLSLTTSLLSSPWTSLLLLSYYAEAIPFLPSAYDLVLGKNLKVTTNQ